MVNDAIHLDLEVQLPGPPWGYIPPLAESNLTRSAVKAHQFWKILRYSQVENPWKSTIYSLFHVFPIENLLDDFEPATFHYQRETNYHKVNLANLSTQSCQAVPCDVDGNVLLHIAIRKDLFEFTIEEKGCRMVPWKHTKEMWKSHGFPRKVIYNPTCAQNYGPLGKKSSPSSTDIDTARIVWQPAAYSRMAKSFCESDMWIVWFRQPTWKQTHVHILGAFLKVVVPSNHPFGGTPMETPWNGQAAGARPNPNPTWGLPHCKRCVFLCCHLFAKPHECHHHVL